MGKAVKIETMGPKSHQREGAFIWLYKDELKDICAALTNEVRMGVEDGIFKVSEDELQFELDQLPIMKGTRWN